MEDLFFRLFERRLRVHVDHPEIHAYFRGAYAPFSSAQRASERCDEAELLVRRASPLARINGEELVLKEGAFRSPFHTALYGSSAIFQRWFLLQRDYCAWYAAGVRIGGEAVVFSAPSGTGKTTLTLELLRRGCGFYGDEFIFVRKRDNVVFPFRRSLLIRDGTRALFSGDARLQRACERSTFHEGPNARSWHFIHACDVFGPQVEAAPAPLRAAILLERGERTSMTPLSPSIFAMNAALRMGHHVDGLERFTAMMQLFDGVRCYRLVAADLASAAGEVCEMAAPAA